MKSCESQATESVIAYMPEEAAPPRKNGELDFQEPWERLSFGIALALYEKKLYTSWEDFRSRLINNIQTWEKSEKKDNDNWNYYEHWLSALEQLVVEHGMLDKHEIETRANELRTGKRDEVFY
ncbi:MAG TPA: nitrile hydratase accessory protein [Anoxybacillus sp.]|jgi:nitrile hydratase accessory protein|nr:nitrile hydratase accessory protein [Anoxybacillus sp.]